MKKGLLIFTLFALYSCASERYRLAWRDEESLCVDATGHTRWYYNEKKVHKMLLKTAMPHKPDVTIYWVEVKHFNWQRLKY